jgi:hypothetical protein
MIYAAWFDLHNDDAVIDHPTAMRVYARLVRNPLIFLTPQEIKTWALADDMHTHRDRVKAALDLLVERGYVIEHPRGTNGVRRLTLAMDREQSAPTIPGEVTQPTSPPTK